MKWYHIYILHPGLDPMEATIHQHSYWIDIREAVYREVTHCDACQRTKWPTNKYSKLPVIISE